MKRIVYSVLHAVLVVSVCCATEDIQYPARRPATGGVQSDVPNASRGVMIVRITDFGRALRTYELRTVVDTERLRREFLLEKFAMQRALRAAEHDWKNEPRTGSKRFPRHKIGPRQMTILSRWRTREEAEEKFKQYTRQQEKREAQDRQKRELAEQAERQRLYKLTPEARTAFDKERQDADFKRNLTHFALQRFRYHLDGIIALDQQRKDEQAATEQAALDQRDANPTVIAKADPSDEKAMVAELGRQIRELVNRIMGAQARKNGTAKTVIKIKMKRAGPEAGMKGYAVEIAYRMPPGTDKALLRGKIVQDGIAFTRALYASPALKPVLAYRLEAYVDLPDPNGERVDTPVGRIALRRNAVLRMNWRNMDQATFEKSTRSLGELWFHTQLP